jgi:hypothetical protein
MFLLIVINNTAICLSGTNLLYLYLVLTRHQAQGCMSVISATWEAEAGGLRV